MLFSFFFLYFPRVPKKAESKPELIIFSKYIYINFYSVFLILANIIIDKKLLLSLFSY